MNENLESELRNALRRKEPSRNLMPRASAALRVSRWWTLPVAAALLIAVGAPAYRVHQQRRAKDQLVFALRLTATKLEHAKAHIRSIGTEGYR